MQSLATAVTAAIGLSAATALIVPGTGTPDAAPDYIDNVVDYYLVPEGKCADNTVANCPTTGIKYFATFWPIPLPGWGGLEGEKWNVSVADGVDHLNDAYDVAVDDLVSPATQTIIETGYNRTDYSKPQPGTLLPPANFNPIKTAVDLVNDIPEGINMALTPGRTPLPGSPPLPATASTLSDTSGTNTIVSNTQPKLFDGKSLVRLGLIAKPGEGVAATGSNGSSTNRPLQNALKDFHPVRDVVKAVSDTVNKALGKDDTSSAGDDAE